MTEDDATVSGKVGYEAYAAFTGGKTFDGRQMPTWEELPDRIRNAWRESAIAILNANGFFSGLP